MALNIFKLAYRWPYRMTAWAPAPYCEPAPLRLIGINLDMKRKPVRCQLLVEKNGSVHSEEFEDALGAGAYFEYCYRVPKGAYSRFSATVGIHSLLGAKRSVDVEVKIDGNTAFSDTITPGKPARTVNVGIGGCRDIRLISSGPWWTDPDGDNNHVVWAEPMLTR